MPSYFYHISLEFLAGENSLSEHHPFHKPANPNTSSSVSLFAEAVREALQPFQKRRAKSTTKSASRAARNININNNTITTTANNNNNNNSGTIAGRSLPASSSGGRNLQHQCRQHQHDQQYGKQRNERNPTATTGHQPNHTSTLPCPATPPSQLPHDRRLDQISIQSIDMVPVEHKDAQTSNNNNNNTNTNTNTNRNRNRNQIAKGIGTNVLGGLATKGRYVPLDQKVSDSAWGIVHLYRDAEETVSLSYDDDDDPHFLKGSSLARNPRASHEDQRIYGSADVVAKESALSSSTTTAAPAANNPSSSSSSSLLSPSSHLSADDCTTLCILAVPSYLSPSDFLGFVGEETRDEVSHFRMIRTARANRYMVLMKFRSGKKAQEWQKDWNGKVFNSMEVSLTFFFSFSLRHYL